MGSPTHFAIIVPSPLQETPLELLRFLALVWKHFGGQVPKACGLSPSTTMDRLWHHILLNTSKL